MTSATVCVTLRRLGAVAALVAVTTSAAAAQSNELTRGWRVTSRAAIKIYAVSGSLSLEGWDRDSIALSGTLADGESLFGGGTLTGMKLGAEGSTRRGASQLRVRLPRRARLVIRTGAADVDIRGVSGTIDVGSAAGSLNVRGTAESVTAESISGAIHLAVLSPSVRPRTTGGTIELVGRVNEAVVTTAGGTVNVVRDPIGRLRVSTLDGRVSVRGALAGTGWLDIETFGGDVQIALPTAQRVGLDLRARDGNIGGRLVTARGGSGDTQRLAITRVGRSSTLLGTLGADRSIGGAPAITVRTFRGNILVVSLDGER